MERKKKNFFNKMFGSSKIYLIGVVVLVLTSGMLLSCVGESKAIKIVKASNLDVTPYDTVGDVFDSYSHIEDYEWSAEKFKTGLIIVKYKANLFINGKSSLFDSESETPIIDFINNGRYIVKKNKAEKNEEGEIIEAKPLTDSDLPFNLDEKSKIGFYVNFILRPDKTVKIQNVTVFCSITGNGEEVKVMEDSFVYNQQAWRKYNQIFRHIRDDQTDSKLIWFTRDYLTKAYNGKL